MWRVSRANLKQLIRSLPSRNSEIKRIVSAKFSSLISSSSTSKNATPLNSSFSFYFNNIQKRTFAVTTENLESLGDSITSAVLVSWSKERGDSIKEDDVIAIVETDKVTMDIKSKKNGVFIEGLVAAGAEIIVGAPLYKCDYSATVAPTSSESTAPVSPPVKSTPSTIARVEVPVPIMGESITTGVIANWSVASGDSM